MTAKERLLEKIATIVYNENRPVSFKDLLSFEWNGTKVRYTHQSLRNLISQLLKDGKIYVTSKSTQAFYCLTGVSLGKSVTPYYIRGKVLLNNKQKALLKFFKINNLGYPSIHDIRLIFTCSGLRSILLNTNSSLIYSIDEKSNKDIVLKDITLDDIILKVTVHNTDKITVMVVCSTNPIPLDELGIARLSSALTRVEERLQWAIDNYVNNSSYHSNMNNKDHNIPDHMSWIVNMWHFGYDSEQWYTGEQFEIKFREGIDVCRVYSKKSKVTMNI